MKNIDFELTEEYIHLIKLLKLLRLVESGGMAKMMVEDGLVTLNGQVELRKRAKLVAGDTVTFDNHCINISSKVS